MARTLEPDSRIAHYRIVGPLGAGGMGEVYRAHDEKLGRDVALKILPPALVRHEDRLRRFILEARSASSLNHPHIVTIYDVGHDTVTRGDDSSAEEVHYISMELVSGQTIENLVHVEETDLRTMLGYLAQAADGLAKAHESGIVHRDLKPGNIMVTDDGYAKVLDFGLAKLTEQSPDAGDSTNAPTATGDGLVVGTVGYMAPEQVRGKGVDHRADVFSFGCLLYEAATRKRPFAAESHIDTLHRILHDDPAPIDTIDGSVPTELRRLIKRCLAKNADQRLQSMKDLAIELREIADEFDQLSASAASGSMVAPAIAAPKSGGGLARAGIVAVVVLGIVGIAFGVYSMLGGRDGGSTSGVAHFESVRMSSLMSGQNLLGTSLSRDGRYLAYVTGPAGNWSMRVRQVATGSDVEVLPPGPELPGEFTFSPDGNYLYMLKRDPDTPNYSALFEVPSLGGTPRKRLFDVDTSVTFSPDGSEVAFLRGVPQSSKVALLTARLAGGEPRVVVEIGPPEIVTLQLPPAWSPDGSRIVVPIQNLEGGLRYNLVAFDPPTGERLESLLGDTYLNINSFAWLPDGSGFVVAGFTRGSLANQIELVGFPGGERRQITTGLDNYAGVVVTADGKSIAALRNSGGGTLWAGGVDDASAVRQLTSNVNEGVGNLNVTGDGTLFFAASIDGYRQLFTMAPDGTGRRQISESGGHAVNPILLPEDSGVVYSFYAVPDMVGHVYRVDLNGGNRIQLTDGEGENASGVSADGTTVYVKKNSDQSRTWVVPVEGGELRLLFEHDSWGPLPSPDGRHIAYSTLREIDGRARNMVHIVRADGGGAVAEFRQPPGAATIQWTPDGEFLSYLDGTEPVRNLWKIPAEGGDPMQLTRFGDGRFNGYRWSDDGTRLSAIRTFGATRSLWIIDADGKNAKQVTDFRSGLLFDAHFTPDGNGVVFIYGDVRTDVVMIADTGA